MTPRPGRRNCPAYLLRSLRIRGSRSVFRSGRPFCRLYFPPTGLSHIAEVEHPGFGGRELEATERFFDAFGLEQPRIPLLTPEFANPLFLKLYCDGLKGLGLSAPPVGEEHISEVFERYLKYKAAANCVRG